MACRCDCLRHGDKVKVWQLVIIGGLLLLAAAPAWAQGMGAKLQRYIPRSPEARELLRAAALAAGLPASWADLDATHELLGRESGGWVGRPNYTFGAISKTENADKWPDVWSKLRAGQVWTSSTATGLGQLLTSNVKLYYPDGLAGIGDPHNEAVGFLRYISDRYGDPSTALAMHGKAGKYINTRTGKQQAKSFAEGY